MRITASGTVCHGYDNNHNRTTTTFPGNTVQIVSYDNAQRIGGISVVNGSNTLNSLTYSYQNNGADTSLVQSVVRSDSSNDNATTTNTYDPLNRLTNWQVAVPTGSALQALSYSYSYDGNGNRTQINAGGAVSNLTYNEDNLWYQAQTSSYTTTYSYDGAGNELGNNGQNGQNPLTITYNAKNQLATITDTQQNVIPMSYSGPSQAERTSAGWVASNPDTPWGNNTYTYGSGMLSQTNSAGVDQGTIHYTYDAYGTPISQRVPGATSSYYYLRDAGGSVLRMVDGSGNVLATYDYCPTGNAPGDITLTSIGQNNPIRYHSMMLDAGSKMYRTADGQYCDTNSGVCTQGGSETSGQNCLLPQGLQVFCNLFRPGPGGMLVVGPLKDFCPPFLNFCPDEGGGSGTMEGSTPQVTFQTVHASRHLIEGSGLTAPEVESAITEAIQNTTGPEAIALANQGLGNSFRGYVTVQGQVIEYRAYVLSSNTISVGTYFPVPFLGDP